MFEDRLHSVRFAQSCQVAGAAGNPVVEDEVVALPLAAGVRELHAGDFEVVRVATKICSQTEQECRFERSEAFVDLEQRHRQQQPDCFGFEFVQQHDRIPLLADGTGPHLAPALVEAFGVGAVAVVSNVADRSAMAAHGETRDVAVGAGDADRAALAGHEAAVDGAELGDLGHLRTKRNVGKFPRTGHERVVNVDEQCGLVAFALAFVGFVVHSGAFLRRRRRDHRRRRRGRRRRHASRGLQRRRMGGRMGAGR